MSQIRRALGIVPAVLALSGGGAAAQQMVDLAERDTPLQLDLTDVFRVGALDGESWQLYGEGVQVEFDARGNLYVFDRANYRIVQVSPTGTFVREIGERGEGPGQLRMPTDFAVLRDGTVVVADVGARALQVYGVGGAWLRSVPFGSDGMLVVGDVLADARGGAVLSAGSRMVSMQVRGGGAPMMPTGQPIVRYPLHEGAAPQDVHQAWEPQVEEAPVQSVSAGSNRTIAFAGGRNRAFQPELFAAPLPGGGLALSDSSAYAIEILDADGAPVRTLRRPFRPREVTESMQEDERERRIAELDAGDGPRVSISMRGPSGEAAQPVPQEAIQQMLRQQAEQLQFYPELPVVTGLSAGWTGKLWVSRRGESPVGPGPIDVLAPEGRYLGTLAADGPGVPDAFGPDGLVAYVELDEFEVVHVAVRRLPAALR